MATNVVLPFALRPGPVTRRVRAYFAPKGTLFDAGTTTSFSVDAPPAPWLDLGWCRNFKRKSLTKIEPLFTGSPASASGQVRTEIDASLTVEFESWGKLPLALTGGAQQINLIAGAAVTPGTGSTAATLDVGVAAANFAIGGLVAVDVDYAGQLGAVGAGSPGSFVRSAGAFDTDYVRRITLNVGRVMGIQGSILTLEAPLLAGAPAVGMKVCAVAGFVDREGASFFAEWSALFVLEGAQGDRVIFHYPRLQAAAGAEEKAETLGGGWDVARLAGSFRALPVRDPLDGEMVVCYRSYMTG